MAGVTGRSPRTESVLGQLLSSGTRAKLLTLFLTHPQEEFYLRQLQRRSGQSLRAVQHELARLERMDIVSIRRQGRQKFYRANAEHPLFPDLKRIIYKTSALGDKLREALGTLERVDAAFVYGSVAKGSERGTSDVDLMILGTPDPEGLTRALQDVEKELGREVSLTSMSAREWHERLASRDAFVTQLVESEKIFVIGDEQSLRTA